MPALQSPNPGRRKRNRKAPPGIARLDSDDELGDEDYPWEWIYDESATCAAAKDSPSETNGFTRKRKRPQATKIVGARMGSFECRLGDCVLLKAEGSSNESWVGIICDFIDDDGDEGEKAAHFMWFSTEKEIRNKEKKRTDFEPNELYITPSWDTNPLTSINGKAQVMSLAAFRKRYPSGKMPRNSRDQGKVFVCRRGCNTRTATYTEEFIWEDVYHGTEEDIFNLVERVKAGTKATRRRRNGGVLAPREDSPDAYVLGAGEDGHGGDDDDGETSGRYRTPKKARKTYDAMTTPSRQKRGGTASKPVTPSSHRKVMVKRHLEFTPLATRTLSPSHYQSSPFQLARAQLHVASVPTSLPCREGEFALVYSHLEAAITDGSGSCIYISGTPGTGKTATVREVVAALDAAVRADELDDFVFVEINGMKVADPHQAYALLWEALRGQRVSPAQALDLLEREFSHPSPRRVPCVVLMDELDQLVTKNQGVMYNFFNWPGLRHSRLIVLAVANTMDLPERTLSNKISSRLGLTRITFPGYNHEQLMKIIQSRLEGVPGDIVDPDAVQFASRKVAAVSGDARRALDICRRAVELAEADSKKREQQEREQQKQQQEEEEDDGGEENATISTPSKRQRRKRGAKDEEQADEEAKKPAKKPTANTPKPKPKSKVGRVTIETVRRAIAEATSSPLQQYLRALPLASRLLLAALLARAQRTGLAESTFGDVLEEAQRALRFSASGSGSSGGGGKGDDSSRPLEVLLTMRQPLNLLKGNNAWDGGGGGNIKSRQQAVAGMRLAGLGCAAVDLTGAGIINLEAHKPERPSKIRLAVGDEEVRLAFRDDPEIKAVGLTL